MNRNLFSAFLLALSLFTMAQTVWADTADDYYREANSFFQKKDYQRAFDAYQGAIPYDNTPNRAYLGMGNCQYFMNNKEKAVEYLQKSDDLVKDEKVEAFIKKVKSDIPPPKTPLFVKAENLLRDKQYKQAAPILKEIEQYESTNLKAFYDLGYCDYALGDKQEATLNFAYYVEKTNDSAVTGLVAKMRSDLTEDDRDWVDAQIQLGPPFSPPFKFSGVGIRFEPSYQLTSMKDFTNFIAGMQKTADQYTATQDASFALTTNLPSGGLAIDLNPYVQLSDDMELGLTFGTLFLGQVTASFTTDNPPSTSPLDVENDAAISYSVVEFGVSLRSELARLYKNKVKLFIELNPALYMAGISTANGEVTQNTVNPGFDFPLVTGNFSSSGLGARFKLGVDWKPVPNSIVSGFIGYQLAQIQGFTGSGTVPDGMGTGGTVAATGQLMTQQGTNGTRIIFVPSSGSTPTGASPLTLDLSGIILGVDMTILL